VFVTYWSWRGIFLVNVPLGLVLLVLGAVVIPGSDRRRTQALDITGVAQLGTGLLGIMLAISSLGSIGSLASQKTLLAAVSLAVGLVALAAFVRHCVRAEHPFIDVRLFRERSFATMNVINYFNGAAVIGFASLVPLYAEERAGLEALSAGTLLTVRAIGPPRPHPGSHVHGPGRDHDPADPAHLPSPRAPRHLVVCLDRPRQIWRRSWRNHVPIIGKSRKPSSASAR